MHNVSHRTQKSEKMRRYIEGIVGIAIVLCVAPLYASDDVEEGIQAGLKSYKAKNYSEAISSLEFAVQQIRQLQASQLETVFPAPLKGWTAQKSESSAMGAAFLGGGITAKQEYEKEDASVSIEMVSNGPTLPMITMMFSNPAMMAADGGKVTKINGEKALVKWNEENKHGEILIVLNNQVLLTIKGDQCAKEDVENYAKAIDFAKIKALSSSGQ